MDEGQEYRISYLAKLFPALSEAQFEGLVTSIRERGLLEEITVWRGEIIDGRHRYLACIKAGVEPRFKHLADDSDPVQYVLDKNSERRDLDASQRAIVAYRLSSMSRPGRPANSQDDEPQTTQVEAALRLRVSRRLVTNVGRVLAEDSGTIPTLRQAVESGRVKISDAAKAVDLPAEVQDQALDRVLRGESKTISSAVGQIQSGAKEAAEAEALESHLAKPTDETMTLHRSAVADLSGLVAPASVDAIITNPSSDPQSLTVFSDLAGFAAHSLKPDGVMVVVNNTLQLPDVLERLKHPDLQWVFEIDLQHPEAPVDVGKPRRITLRRMSLLIYGKPGFKLNAVDNVMALRTSDELPLAQLQRRLFDEAMALIVERFARPGQVICNPILLHRAGTALAARKHGCYFIGADQDEVNLSRVRKALTQDEGDVGSDFNSQVRAPERPNPPVFRTEEPLPDPKANPIP